MDTKKIIFIDNEIYNVLSVIDSLNKGKISSIGTHFTFVNDESNKYPEDQIKKLSIKFKKVHNKLKININYQNI